MVRETFNIFQLKIKINVLYVYGRYRRVFHCRLKVRKINLSNVQCGHDVHSKSKGCQRVTVQYTRCPKGDDRCVGPVEGRV